MVQRSRIGETPWSEREALDAIAAWSAAPASADKRLLSADLVDGLIGALEKQSFAHARDQIDQALTALWRSQFETARRHMVAAFVVTPLAKATPSFDALRRRVELLRDGG